jgi:hypothetical protein
MGDMVWRQRALLETEACPACPDQEQVERCEGEAASARKAQEWEGGEGGSDQWPADDGRWGEELTGRNPTSERQCSQHKRPVGRELSLRGQVSRGFRRHG